MFFSKVVILGGAAAVERDSWGLVGQVGFDYMFTKNLGVNLDVKYIKMDTDVFVTGLGKIGTLKLNPVTAGVGVTYRF